MKYFTLGIWLTVVLLCSSNSESIGAVVPSVLKENTQIHSRLQVSKAFKTQHQIARLENAVNSGERKNKIYILWLVLAILAFIAVAIFGFLAVLQAMLEALFFGLGTTKNSNNFGLLAGVSAVVAIISWIMYNATRPVKTGKILNWRKPKDNSTPYDYGN